MEKKYLRKLFLFEVLVVVLVPFIFKWIEPKKVAALFAGGLFVILGISAIYASLRYPRLQKTFFTLAAGIHLFMISVPMLAARIFYFDRDFDQIEIMGFRAPDFHHYSEYVFVALMVATAYQWFKATRVGSPGVEKPV